MKHLQCRICKVMKRVLDSTETALCARCVAERNVCDDDSGVDSRCVLPVYHHGDHMSERGAEWPSIILEPPDWLA